MLIFITTFTMYKMIFTMYKMIFTMYDIYDDQFMKEKLRHIYVYFPQSCCICNGKLSLTCTSFVLKTIYKQMNNPTDRYIYNSHNGIKHNIHPGQ